MIGKTLNIEIVYHPRMFEHPVILVLADVRSAENVGSMFRTADAAGVREIVLSGYTPAPIDRFGRPQKAIEKTALGAESWLPWTAYASHDACLRALKEAGYRIVALEQTSHAVPYLDHRIETATAMVVGNEVAGVPQVFLDASDAHIVIPMAGKKESLNVSVAAGIALFGLRDR
jgi:tRNA G18 (ribose-2'-O)-methylase SpoU